MLTKKVSKVLCTFSAISAWALFPIQPASATSELRSKLESDVQLCLSGGGPLDLHVALCSRALSALTDEPLAVANLLTHRGRYQMELGRLDAAAGDFEQALVNNPSSVEALRWQAENFRRQRRLTEAKRSLDAAQSISFKNFAVARAQGWLAMDQGDLMTAELQLLHAVEWHANDGEALTLNGIRSYLNADFVLAEMWFARAESVRYEYAHLGIWRWLAQVQNGAPTAEALREREMADLDADEWPMPLWQALSSHESAEGFLANPPQPRSRADLQHFREGVVLAAEWLRVNGNRALALPFLQRVAGRPQAYDSARIFAALLAAKAK